LSGWKPLATSGEPILSQARDTAGNPLLSISTGPAPSGGSWRTRVVLGEGRYRFEGRVRVSGVTSAQGDARAGAGLRVSRGIMPQKLTGTTEWTGFAYAFAVEGEPSDVE
jgi:hypothetical protein